jgi:hypothetical protein
MLVLLSRDLGGSVVRPRELPDLWTAHYKGNGFLDFVDSAMKPKMLPSAEAA